MKINQGISEGQVLQRRARAGANALISGECARNGPVLATISDRGGALKSWKARAVGACSRGRFAVVLEGIPDGGPYRLVLECAGRRATVRAFYVGDVWLLAGQSNMEGVGDMSSPAKPHPLVRAFGMNREWRLARDPLHVLAESPDVCHSGGNPLPREQARRVGRDAEKGVGVGVFFGREMLARSGVPQGLICTAHGGTNMKQWSPDLKDAGGDSLYGSMMLSLRATAQPVAGVLWYQGESDTDPEAAAVYTEKTRALVAAVRRDLRQPDLPWLMVQIGVVYGNWGGPAWNNIQEQQRLLPRKIKNLSVVVSADLPLDDYIHISSAGFPRLAARLAREAARLVHGDRRERPMPALAGIVAPKPPNPMTHVDVRFDNIVGGLRSAGLPRGFALLDRDGREIPAFFKTTLRGDTVRLHLHKGFIPPEGALLAHGHGKTPVCNITDARDCPLPVFGPQSFVPPHAVHPFLTAWQVTPVLGGRPPLASISCPDPDAEGAQPRVYNADGLVNEHERWDRHPGHAYFASRIRLEEPMRLQFLIGYDGPFRLWVDKRPVFADLAGINPCVPDKSSKTVSLGKGEHTITVAMDTNGGAAWGFFLRLRRMDVTASALRGGNFKRALPVI